MGSARRRIPSRPNPSIPDFFFGILASPEASNPKQHPTIWELRKSRNSGSLWIWDALTALHSHGNRQIPLGSPGIPDCFSIPGSQRAPAAPGVQIPYPGKGSWPFPSPAPASGSPRGHPGKSPGKIPGNSQGSDPMAGKNPPFPGLGFWDCGISWGFTFLGISKDSTQDSWDWRDIPFLEFLGFWHLLKLQIPGNPRISVTEKSSIPRSFSRILASPEASNPQEPPVIWDPRKSPIPCFFFRDCGTSLGLPNPRNIQQFGFPENPFPNFFSGS